MIAVDPAGLAALLSLTGPVTVPQWPTAISADNVVDVTLRDAYATLGTEAQTEERVDFLGDVAHAASTPRRPASSGSPATIAKALGAAAHEGHLVLAFARPDEQRLAEELDAAGHVRCRPIRLARGHDVELRRQQDRLLPRSRRSTTGCSCGPTRRGDAGRRHQPSSTSTSTTPRRRPGSRRS